MAAVSYEVNDFYTSALYTYATEDGSDTDTNGLEVAAAYKIDKIKLQAIYNYAKEDASGTKTTTVSYFNPEVIYKWNKNFRAYAGYKVNVAKADNNKADEIQAGVRFDF